MEIMETTSFDQACSTLRTELKSIGANIIVMRDLIKECPLPDGADRSEMIANVVLAYRHLEDAAMRLGKAIQAYEGGAGIYDNKDAQRVAGQ